MKRDHPTEDSFLNDVKDHKMIVMQNEGVNRHLIFRKPNDNDMWFGIITIGDFLFIVGDMGSFTFTRNFDMFHFFRSDPEKRKGQKLTINPSYWHEKCVAADRDGGKKFSYALWKEQVERDFKDYWDAQDNPDAEQLCREELEDFMAFRGDDEHECWELIRNFESQGFSFRDWESSCRDYTYHFLWVLYAIVWGIQTFDKSKEKS